MPEELDLRKDMNDLRITYMLKSKSKVENKEISDEEYARMMMKEGLDYDDGEDY